MNFRTHRTASSWWPLILVLAVLVAIYTGRPTVSAGKSSTAAAVPPQDVTRIESRLSQLEQRFYSIETSIRGLEQQSRLSDVRTERATRDPEVGLLRADVEALRRRLAEIECGVVKMDERTLTPAAKEARQKSVAGGAGDPCRLNAEAPLRLPTRP